MSILIPTKALQRWPSDTFGKIWANKGGFSADASAVDACNYYYINIILIILY